MLFNTIYKGTKERQVSPDRIASISDYEGNFEERLNGLIDDHLKYVNNHNGTPDFSSCNRELEDINNLDKYILVIMNNLGDYVRVKLPLSKLLELKETIVSLKKSL